MATFDAVGKRSLFRRGLNATRLALAFAVTVVVVTIVVYAIVVVSRKEQLNVSVGGGIIHVWPKSDPTELGLTFSVEASNPSGRVRFYYTNIWGNVILKNGTNSTDTFTFARFPLGGDDMDIAPVTMLQRDADATVQVYNKISTYFYELRDDNRSSIISDAILKLNGTLTVGLYSVHNNTPQETFYYCWPLTIGAAGNVSADAAQDVLCQNDDPRK